MISNIECFVFVDSAKCGTGLNILILSNPVLTLQVLCPHAAIIVFS